MMWVSARELTSGPSLQVIRRSPRRFLCRNAISIRHFARSSRRTAPATRWSATGSLVYGNTVTWRNSRPWALSTLRGPGRAITHRAARRAQPAKALRVGEQFQPAPPSATGQRLVLKRVAGHALPGAFDGHPQVDVLVLVTGETVAELKVQSCRDLFRKRPAQNRQGERLRGHQPGRGRGYMIEVTLHGNGVEDQQPVRETGVGRGDHVRDQPGLARFTQGPIRAVSHFGASRAEHVHRRSQLSPAESSEVSRGTLQRPGLTMGQAQYLDLGAREDERVQDRAETE